MSVVLYAIHIWAWGGLAVMSASAMRNIREGKSLNDGISLYKSLAWPSDVVEVFGLVIKKMMEK